MTVNTRKAENTDPWWAGIITAAELFAAQSTLCVDEPGGESTAGTPAELFQWARQHGARARRTDTPGGTGVHVRFQDGSSAVILHREHGNVIIMGNRETNAGGMQPPLDDEDMWGRIGPGSPEGRAWLEELRKLAGETRT